MYKWKSFVWSRPISQSSAKWSACHVTVWVICILGESGEFETQANDVCGLFCTKGETIYPIHILHIVKETLNILQHQAINKNLIVYMSYLCPQYGDPGCVSVNPLILLSVFAPRCWLFINVN